MNKNILVPTVTGVLALSIGFFGGYSYRGSIQTNNRQFNGQYGMMNGLRNQNGQNQRNGTGMGMQFRNGGAPISGKIIKSDDTSITVQSPDGSNRIVMITAETKINKTQESNKSDLKEGTEVLVIGKNNNGTISAQTISIGNFFTASSITPTPTK